MNYTKLLNESYEHATKNITTDCRLEFIGAAILDVITYDSGMDKLYASKMLPVIKSIRHFDLDFQKQNEENYFWMINTHNIMPFECDWGSSIRGAWFSHEGQDIRVSWAFYDGEQLERLKLSAEEFEKFIDALCDWSGLWS